MNKVLLIASLLTASSVFAMGENTSSIQQHILTLSPGVISGGAEIIKFETYPISEEKKKSSLRKMTSPTSTGSTSTRVAQAGGHVNQNIRIDSYHSFKICNDNKYAAYFQVRGELKDDQYHSTSDSSYTMVMANSCATGSLHIYFLNSYPYPGTYKTTATTDIDNSNKSTDTSIIDVRK